MLGVLPAAAQSTGIHSVWFSYQGTSHLADRLFGPGVAEVVTSSTGATTAGGRVSWVKYFEKDDHLGMHHVYYRQQYHHPQLGRALRVLGTAVSLHYAPDGSLRRAHLAQVDDVPALPAVTLSTPQQVFAAAQMGLGSWPEFRLGDPSQWPPGVLASILEDTELMLAVPHEGGTFRLQWRVPTLDADRVPHTALVDATTGALLAVRPTNPEGCPGGVCAHCSPGYDDEPTAASVAARARPENWELIPCSFRYVAANPCTAQNEATCSGGACSYEAVWEGTTGIPQIEVYHGMAKVESCQHCYWEPEPVPPPPPPPPLPCGTHCPYEGSYMRVGLIEDGPLGLPTYDLYPEPEESEGEQKSCSYEPHPYYRRFAGDAMYYTRQTMEVLWDKFERCGFDGSCEIPARIVVDARGCHDAARFFSSGYAEYTTINGVAICQPAEHPRSMSAAIDIVAHEWGHGVSKFSPSDFPAMCADDWNNHPEPCEMCEGFADVVGHIVERFKQPTPDAGSWIPDRWDWIQGEDWAPVERREFLRRANEYDANTNHSCPGERWSVHAEDPGCEGNLKAEHANGNRLSVVLRLMAEGGHNPAFYHANLPFPCTGCEVNVQPLDPDPLTSFEMAAQILFRVLDTEANVGTNDWDLLPYHARNVVQDLYPDRCEEAQWTVIQAFRAVGYPQGSAGLCVMCGGPYQSCPPCCPPDCCYGVEE